MSNKIQQKGIEEYRRDIKVLKYKLNKLMEEQAHINQKVNSNEHSTALYVRPMTKNMKSKTVDYYMNEFYQISIYRGITLEQLFRAFDIQQTNNIPINEFKAMMHDFLKTQIDQDEKKHLEMEDDISKLQSMICSQLDSNYRGIIEKDEYIQMLQIHRIEQEPFQFQIKHITIQGVDEQLYQNIYQHALTIFRNYLLVSSLNAAAIIKQLKETLKIDNQTKKITNGQFISFASKFSGFNTNLALGLFNYFDRYFQNELDLNYLENQLKKILDPLYNVQTSTQFLNIDNTQDQLTLSLKIRDLFKQVKVYPIDAYLECDKDYRGKVRLGSLFKTIEGIFVSQGSTANLNILQMWLRMLDGSKSYHIDCLRFVYSIINEEDINRFSTSQTERAKLIKTQNTFNDYEVISGFGLRLKSLSMKPGDWFKMLISSPTQLSVSVYDVKLSLFKLGVDIGHVVEILKLLDQNLNFFVEYEEIMQLFGSGAALQQEQNLDEAIKELADFLVKNYRTINRGIDTIFLKYDEDKTGTLSREEFLYALDSVDEHLHLDEHQKALILEAADKNRDNQITIQEFKEWIYLYTDPEQLQPNDKTKSGDINKIKKKMEKDDKKVQTKAQSEILRVIRLPCISYIFQLQFLESLLKFFDYYQILDQLEQQNKLYTDQIFTPDQKSLTNDMKRFNKAIGIEWLRPTDFLDQNNKYQVFKDSIEPNDILQGSLGDCYFLSSLSVLAEKPYLIKRLFETQEINFQCCYCLWLCVDAEWKWYILDDFFPCVKQEVGFDTVFSRAHSSELWVLLLEKAYAKAFGTYDKIEAGLTGQAIRDLTGSPYEYFNSKDVEQVWNFLSKNKIYLLTAGSQVSQSDKDQGIVSAHAYSILDVNQVELEKGSFRLIQMRNPWGQGEWKGKWSDSSNVWTEEAKQKLNYENKNDGIFWIEVGDFIGQFSEICCNKLYENYIYCSTTIKCDKKQGNIWRGFLKIFSSNTNQHSFITVSQYDKRHFLHENTKYDYGTVRCIIWKGRREEKVQIIADKFGQERDLTMEVNFKEKQEYGIYVEFEYKDALVDNFTPYFVISSYSIYETLFSEQQQLQTLEEEQLLINQILMGLGSDSYNATRYVENALIFKMEGQIAGYIFFKYINNSNDATLIETLRLKNTLNLSNWDGSELKQEYKIQVAAKQNYSICFRINQQEFSYQSEHSYRIDTQYSDQQIAQLAESKSQRVNKREGANGPLEVYAYDYLFGSTLAIVIKNKDKRTYQESLKLELKNLKSADDRTQFQFTVKPKDFYLIKLTVVIPEKPISYGQAYVGQLI